MVIWYSKKLINGNRFEVDIHILTVREQARCDQIIELSYNDDTTYLRGIADGMEGTTMTWVAEPVLTGSYFAISPNFPHKMYSIRLWSAFDAI